MSERIIYMSNSSIIVLSSLKRALIVDIVGGAVITAGLAYGHGLFSAYVMVASSLAARFAGV